MINYTVKPIKPFETHDWLLHKHYAKRIPSISYAFGLYDQSLLTGICTFGSPASPSLCIGICGEEYRDKVIELNRLCVEESSEKNQCSYFVSRCLKLLPKETIVVSYSDTSMGHHGYIYQATNFLYTGLSAKRTDRAFIEGHDNKHSRHIIASEVDDFHNRTELVERPQKHRYVYFIGSKSWVKKMRGLLRYPTMSYPKGDNKRYDATYEPTVQRRLI